MGFLALKFDQGGRLNRRSKIRIDGVPDIIAMDNRGRFFAIEVKRESGRVSKAQQEFIDKINQMNGIAFVCRSLSELKRELIVRGLM